MSSKRWWPWFLVTLMVGGCGRTSKNGELCTDACAGEGGTPTSGGASFGGSSFGGSFSAGSPSGGSLPVAGGPTAVCEYGTPQSPLVVYSPLDLELSMDEIVGPGPSFEPTYADRADAGSVRAPSIAFVKALYDGARARVDEPESTAMAPCVAADESGCIDTWIRERGLRIYRRPLTEEQVATYAAAYSQQRVNGTAEAAAKSVLLSMLLSPYFVYRIELANVLVVRTIAPPGDAPGAPLPPVGNPLGAFEIAARLSHFVWRRSPDQQLLDSAASGRLSSLDGVLSEFDRLLADQQRSWLARTEQQLEWLQLEQWGKLEPEAAGERELNEQEQTRTFIADVLFNRGGSLTELLTSGRQPLNGELAQELGIPGMLGLNFELVDLDPAFYAGVLGQPAWLRRNPRPSARGARLMSQFLCQEVPPPPPNEPPLGPGATPRERISSVTASNPACHACHSLFDPLGFALEAFDEKAHLTGFDTTGTLLIPRTGESRPLAGPSDLGRALATSMDTKSCATLRAVQYLLQTTQIGNEAQPLLDCVARNTGNDDLNLNELARQVASSSAMLRTLRSPSNAVGVGKSAEPVQHAMEETMGLVTTLPPEESASLRQYYDALNELLGLPPPK